MKRYFTLLLLCLGLTHLVTGQDCDINELVVEQLECENGLFNVVINFNVLNPDGDNFGVMGNGNDYGTFPYNSLPITLGPLEGDGVTEWEFVVFDVANPECNAAFVLGIVQCCGFNEVVVDPTECTNQEVFNAIVNFNHFGTGGLGFDVFSAGGEPLGFFEYEDLPVTVMGIPSVDGFTHITICDNDNADCCVSVEFESLDCNTEDCNIFDVNVLVSECENGVFFVTINFGYENVGPSFEVHGNGNDYGTFEYGDLPITLGPLEGDGVTVYEFGISDTEFQDCGDFAVIEPVSCEQSCDFFEVNIDPIECQGNGYYQIGMNFGHEGTGDNFSVFSQGEFIASFSYDELPVFLDSFPSSCNDHDVITICDNADTTCCETFEFVALACCEECNIFDLVAEATECNDEGQFFVVISFQYENVSDEGFNVHGNGNNYGNFNYEDLPITLGPFEGDGTLFYEFAATDLGDESCSDGVGIGFINCDCGFEEITVDVLECSGNGTYALELNFIPVGVTNDGFDVFAGNEFVGFYLYENLPVVVEHFPDGDGNVDVITICDNDNPSCCTSHEFEENLECLACDIFELAVDVSDCNPETNTFSITLNFDWLGDAEEFNVYKGNVLIGTVVGANLPETIDGLTDDGGGALITVCATTYPDCCASVEVAVPDCGACDIFELDAIPFNCNPETGTFDLHVNFLWEGDVETFDVFMGDDFIGVVEGANLPDTLTGLIDDGGGALIRVCANDNAECCAQVEIVPGCVEACDIFELGIEVSDCDSLTETFSITINFGWTGNVDVFDVFKGDNLIATIEGADLPVTIDGLTDDGGGALFSVCANDNFDCCAAQEVQVPQCGEEPCDIFELVAEAFDCDTSTNTFALYIDFQWTGNDEVFNVFKGNQLIGTVEGANLPDTLYGLTDDGGGALITVCSDNHPDCCASDEISVPECGAVECEIFEVDADPGECTGDSTFTLSISYQYQGFENEFVDVWTGDTYLGFFHVDIQPIIITDFPWNGNEVMPLRICQNDHPDCCRIIEFGVPDCLYGEECGIFEIVVEPVDCTSDSTFAAWVNFDAQGFDGSVQMWAGDTYLGVFSQDAPVLVTNIPENDGGIVLTICQAENQECCAEHEFQGMICENIGDIENLTVTVSECDGGTFMATLTFDYENVSDSFGVAGNGILFGVFAYAALPVTIGPLPGDNETQWEFVAYDQVHPLWRDDAHVGIVNCITGVFSPTRTLPLAIAYGTDGASFIAPVNTDEYSLWTYDGKLIRSDESIQGGDRIVISRYLPVPGMYFVQVGAGNRTYVGKVVGF